MGRRVHSLSRTMIKYYCPACGSEFTETWWGPSDTNEGGLIMFDGWCVCPKHGEIHVEFYRPSGEKAND